MSHRIRILIIEDSEDDYELVLLKIKKAGYKVISERIETESELILALDKDWDVIISDNSLPTFNAPKALKITRSRDLHIPFLIVSGTIGEEAAVEAMRAGANDYILKHNLNRLIPAIERELREHQKHFKRLEVELALNQSLKMYQFLSGSIQDVFIALNKSYRILDWNDYATKEFLPKERVLGKNIFSIFPKWLELGLDDKFENVILEKKSQDISFDYEQKEFFEGSIYPTENGISIIAKKVTEQKKVKENLIRINNELETLMYRISHDLKGPVASIKGLINIGLNDFANLNDVKSLMYMMENSTDKLRNTLDELLNITRIKQGQINPEKIFLSELIMEVIDGLKYNDGYKDAKVILKIDGTLEVRTDQRLLKSVMQNLLENAIKYKKPGSESIVEIDAIKNNNINLINIIDNGEGIPDKFLPHIFKMFYRANLSSHGSGLGLYIVRNALDKMQGHVTCESKVNVGSKFKIQIPDWND